MFVGLTDYIKKKQRERAEKQRVEEVDSKKLDNLLDKFEIPDFDDFFKKVLCDRPDTEYEFDKRLGKDEAKNFLEKYQFLKKEIPKIGL